MSAPLCHGWSRRDVLKAASLGLLGFSASGWFPALADEIAADPKRRRRCILLWMAGGPTQTDTFDMKPGHVNSGEFKEVETKVPGLKFSEHLPKLAAQADKLAIIRSLSTKEGDHGRGTYLMRTGQRPAGPIAYPGIGSSLSKALGREEDAVPQNVAIAPYRAFNQAAFGPGFLGPRFAPLTVGATDTFQAPMPGAAGTYAELRVDDLSPPTGVDADQVKARLKLWKVLQDRFVSTHRLASPIAHQTVYEKALKLMDSDAAKAFDLSQEPEKVRDAYGKGRFGQGCLMARRLIEQGVSFVEVTLGSFTDGTPGWDTHQQNFPAVKNLSAELDNGWGTLMQELSERGLLESTTILWMGEFGRTPKINPSAGRDHFPAAWTCVLAGGGIKGGQAYGKTSDSGEEVTDGKVDVGDVLATFCAAAGVDPTTENISPLGRPLKIAEGTVIGEVVA
ncbi:MAG TPA: DUF1501 domain-containing protein [Pirellulaceae bacterium]|nr:DUF1501 domain-containing protein [Pirellulaceae bacterium]